MKLQNTISFYRWNENYIARYESKGAILIYEAQYEIIKLDIVLQDALSGCIAQYEIIRRNIMS